MFNGLAFDSYRVQIDGIAVAEDSEIAYGRLVDSSNHGRAAIPFAMKGQRAMFTNNDIVKDAIHWIQSSIDRGQISIYLVYL